MATVESVRASGRGAGAAHKHVEESPRANVMGKSTKRTSRSAAEGVQSVRWCRRETHSLRSEVSGRYKLEIGRRPLDSIASHQLPLWRLGPRKKVHGHGRVIIRCGIHGIAANRYIFWGLPCFVTLNFVTFDLKPSLRPARPGAPLMISRFSPMALACARGCATSCALRRRVGWRHARIPIVARRPLTIPLLLRAVSVWRCFPTLHQ